MAVVHLRAFGRDATEVAAAFERLLRRACEPGLGIMETADHAFLSCEILPRDVASAEVEDLAAAVLGDRTQAERFLRQPHPTLGMRRPSDVIRDSEEGVRMVRQVLGRMLLSETTEAHRL